VYAIVVMPVRVEPGAIAFTRDAIRASSMAATRVNMSTPPFDAQYADRPVRRDVGVRRRDVDDRAWPRGASRRRIVNARRDEKGADEVPRGARTRTRPDHSPERRARADTGGIDEDVRDADVCRDRVERRVDRMAVGHVELGYAGVPPPISCASAFTPSPSAVGQHHAGARLAREPRARASDARRWRRSRGRSSRSGSC
jgi:hypothetical protein